MRFVGGAQIELTRWDLFHSHLFYTNSGSSMGLGMLFHAKEYPRQCKAFPYNLGYCQRNSLLEYDERGMDLRNLLYFQVQDCSSVETKIASISFKKHLMQSWAMDLLDGATQATAD